jgi:TRAP-type C4-dicarboxylate transport system permease small subunit
MNLFRKGLQWLIESMKTVGAACLVGMILLTCVDVAGRFFNRPIFGSVELVAFMAAISVAMALPYTHQVRGHIGVEIVFRLLPGRVQRIIHISTSILAFILFSIVTWRMALYARTLKASGEVSISLKLPVHLLVGLVAFCFLVFALVILKEIARLLKHEEEP